MFPFDPPENIRKPKVFLCFQEDRKGTLGNKGLINPLKKINPMSRRKKSFTKNIKESTIK